MIADHKPRLWQRLRRGLAVGLALPVLAGAGKCGDVLYEIGQRALILEPIELVRFSVDSGDIEVYAFNRTAINLFYHLTGSEHDIGDVGYEIVDTELHAFIGCVELGGFCNADFNVEVPYGTKIVATASKGAVKLIGVDAEVAVVASGDFTGVDLNSPTLAVTVEAGTVAADLRSTPAEVRIAVESGAVDLTLPAGSYRCELQARDGAIVTTGIVCDPMAASLLKIEVTSGDIHVQSAP